MAKFYGYIGYATVVESQPGVWENVIVEKPYYGDIIRDAMDRVGGQDVISKRKLANSFRIVADPYASNNYMDMTYVLWDGHYLEIVQVEIQNRPRMLIRVGGVYNGPRATSDTP